MNAQFKWFDLEITDGKITAEIRRKAVEIFRYWKDINVVTQGKQRLTKWRPSNSLTLISNKNDFNELHDFIAEMYISSQNRLPNRTTSLLFESESVLRFIIE